MNSNPRRDAIFWIRRNHLAELVDIEKAAGLEIGAMDLPFVEPGEGDCDYADIRTPEELRQEASRIPPPCG